MPVVLLFACSKGPTAAGWEVKEQVAVAAMDCAANRFAFQLVEAIRNEFPSSKRADRLTVRRTSVPFS